MVVGRGAIVWGAHSALLIIANAQVVAVLIYFRFVLVPLTLAYFFTFLLSPVQNLFEYRCGTQPKTAHG